MSSGDDNNGQMASKSNEDTASASPEGENAGGSGSSGGFMDRFNIREYASSAEKKADELNSQFGSLCNKFTGDKSTEEKKAEDGEEGLVSQITDFGTKGYGLMGALGKKFEGAKK